MSDADADAPVPIIPPFELNVFLKWGHLPPEQRVAIYPRWTESSNQIIRPLEFAANRTNDAVKMEQLRTRVQRTLFDTAMERCKTPQSKLNIAASSSKQNKNKRQTRSSNPLLGLARTMSALRPANLEKLLYQLGCTFSYNTNPRKTYVGEFSLEDTMKLPRHKLLQFLSQELLPNSLNVFEQSILQSRTFVCRTVPSTILTYPPGSLTLPPFDTPSSRDVFPECPDAAVAIVASVRLTDVVEFETDQFYQMHRLNLPDVPGYYDRYHHNKPVPLVVHNFPLPQVEVFDDTDGLYGLVLYAGGHIHSTSVYCAVLGDTDPAQLDKARLPSLSLEEQQKLYGDWRFCDTAGWSLSIVSPHARFQPPLDLIKLPFQPGDNRTKGLRQECLKSTTVVLYGVEYRTIKEFVLAQNDKYVDDDDDSANCRRVREGSADKLWLELLLVRYMPTGFPEAKRQFMEPLFKQHVDKLLYKRAQMYHNPAN